MLWPDLPDNPELEKSKGKAAHRCGKRGRDRVRLPGHGECEDAWLSRSGLSRGVGAVRGKSPQDFAGFPVSVRPLGSL